MSVYRQERLISITDITNSNAAIFGSLELIPARTRPARLEKDTHRFDRGQTVGWDIEAIFDGYHVIKTVSYIVPFHDPSLLGEDKFAPNSQPGGELIDRYYVRKGEQVCLVAKRQRYLDGYRSSVMFLNNVNGFIFSRTLPTGFPLESLSKHYRGRVHHLVPSVFERDESLDYESVLKNGLNEEESYSHFDDPEEWAIADTLGLTGWRAFESLRLSRPEFTVGLNEILFWEQSYLISTSSNEGVCSEMIKHTGQLFSEVASQWLCRTDKNDAQTSLPSFYSQYRISGSDYSLENILYVDLFEGTEKLIKPSKKQVSTNALIDEITSSFWDYGIKDVSTVTVVRTIHDLVKVVFYNEGGVPIGDFAFDLSKRMLLNYGLVNSSVFTGRASV